MKTYALERVDGGVEIMQTNISPEECFSKWHPTRRSEITGKFKEVSILPDRATRALWKYADL